MSEVKMDNVKEKLAKSRELCPGFSEEVYALTDYMSQVANDVLLPEGMVGTLLLCLSDIEDGKNCFYNTELPEYLLEHKEQVLEQAEYVPQVIDIIAEEKFAEQFRETCKEILGFDPPKTLKKDNNYPEYINIAVEWWADAISEPSFDNGDKGRNGEMASLMALMLSAINPVSKSEIEKFKEVLAEEIEKDLKYGMTCSLRVDYRPEGTLNIAAKNSNIENSVSFPWKTRMLITTEEVKVTTGGFSNYKTIWKK